MPYMELAVPSNMVENKLGGTCMSWSTSDEINHKVCGKELECGSVSIGT